MTAKRPLFIKPFFLPVKIPVQTHEWRVSGSLAEPLPVTDGSHSSPELQVPAGKCSLSKCHDPAQRCQSRGREPARAMSTEP